MTWFDRFMRKMTSSYSALIEKHPSIDRFNSFGELFELIIVFVFFGIAGIIALVIHWL